MPLPGDKATVETDKTARDKQEKTDPREANFRQPQGSAPSPAPASAKKVSALDTEGRVAGTPAGNTPGAAPLDAGMTVDPATNSHRTDEHERAGPTSPRREKAQDPSSKKRVVTLIDPASGTTAGVIAEEDFDDEYLENDLGRFRVHQVSTPRHGVQPVIFLPTSDAELIRDKEPNAVVPDAFHGMGQDYFKGLALTHLMSDAHERWDDDERAHREKSRAKQEKRVGA